MSLPDPNAPPESVILKNFKGLRNNVRPERLALNEFELAKNVDIDDAEQVSRRRGYVLKLAGNFHSIFTAIRGVTYGVKDGSFGIINPNFTFRSLQGDAGSRPFAYVELANVLYFSSATNSYQLNMDTEVVSPWGAITSEGIWYSPVAIPTDTLGKVAGKLLGAPPNGEYLAEHNGRIYIGYGRTIWATELFYPNYVDKTRTFLHFEHDVGGIADVADGLFVGTTKGIYFLSGEFGQMQRRMVSPYGIVPGSMVRVAADRLNPEVANGAKRAVMMMTTDGVCVGLDSGQFTNLSGGRFEFPQAESATAMLREIDGFSQYVAVTDSRGDPTNTARFGDYVEAEIVRFNQGA
jgi:hypothetical protein